MLTGKIALITGAGKGIGAQIAKTMAGYGATVIINYSHSEDGARAVMEEITKKNGKADIYKCDVADFNEVKKMIDYVTKQYGRIDILVNNAGVTKDNLSLRMKEEEFDQVININLKGTFNCMRHIAKTMLKQKYGRIITISSVVGIMGNAGQMNYSASKAGVIGMTKTIARELGSKGITANAIAPGFIETEMTKVLSEEVQEKAKQNIPLGHFGNPVDIAEAAAFLASDKAAYITGHVLVVDGGMAM